MFSFCIFNAGVLDWEKMNDEKSILQIQPLLKGFHIVNFAQPFIALAM
jgi:hypothetical protein